MHRSSAACWTSAFLPLSRMQITEANELLTVYSAEHNGRLRKYYRITDAGLIRLEEFKTEWKEVLSIFRFITKEGVANE